MSKQKSQNQSYTYVLQDTRKPGKYQYGKLILNWEPFYVGKGLGPRYAKHIKLALERNTKGPLYAKIRKIKREGYDIAVRIVRCELTDAEAIALEIKLIQQIGRRDLNCGPLVNLTSGGEGHRGFIKSQATRIKHAASVSSSWKTRSAEARKASLANLTSDWRNDPVKMSKIQAQTSDTMKRKWLTMPKAERARLVAKRRAGILEYHANRTPEQKAAASEARRRSWETRKKLSPTGKGYR